MKLPHSGSLVLPSWGSVYHAAPLPAEVAPWAVQVGTFWFDSALAFPGSRSLLAICPMEWLRGSLGRAEDVRLLERSLQRGRNEGWSGGLAGAVSYEGDFIFGVYQHWYGWWVEAAQWDSPPPEPEKATEAGHEVEGFSLWLQPEWSQAEFEQRVRRIQQWIAAGDIYQACLTYAWRGELRGSPWAAYVAFRNKSPAPMACFARLPEGRSLLSASPELFLSLRDREIMTRPIKGTRARPPARMVLDGQESENDLVAELEGSVKERAELTMITDLERNDLGQICAFGSVRVRDFLQVERFAQVLHLVSTVEGRLRPEISHPEALAACFPGGSISGAPKKRAREILRELESGARGFYTGALGYFGFEGGAQFSIPIRTLVVEKEKASYGTGAGIVADSDPEKEWAETLAKARGILELCEPSSPPGALRFY